MFRASRIAAGLVAALSSFWFYGAVAQVLRERTHRPGAKLLLAGWFLLIASSAGFAQGSHGSYGPGVSQVDRPNVRLESFLGDSAQRYINNAVDAINRCSVSDFTDAIHGLDSVISALSSDVRHPEANYYRVGIVEKYRIFGDKHDIDSLRHLIAELNKTARLRWPACREHPQTETPAVTYHGRDPDYAQYMIQRILAFFVTGVLSPELGVDENEISVSENRGTIDPFHDLNLGLFVSGGRSQNTFVETFAPTGEQTSKDSFGATRVGGGFTAGVDFCTSGGGCSGAPCTAKGTGCNAGLLFEPFIQIEDPNTSARFPFAGGSFIGVESNFEVTAGAKIGPMFSGPNGGSFWLFGTVAASFENEKLTVNFVPISSSENKTIPGLTAGFGVQVQPAGLRLFGMPAAVSVEYQHTFWQTAHVDTPASSPFFNYGFPREDDKVLAGFHVHVQER